MSNRKTVKKKPGPKPGSAKVPGSGGSRKGKPNKATSRAREAVALFVEGNIDRLQSWLDQIADQDPKAAFQCFMDVVEYHIPKLSRQDLSAEVEHKGGVTFVLPEQLTEAEWERSE
jgi:hypothetical protein